MDLADYSSGTGIASGYIFKKYGIHLSKAKIAYLQDSKPTEKLHPDLESSDIDKTLKFFKDSQEISFQVLWDIPSGKSS